MATYSLAEEYLAFQKKMSAEAVALMVSGRWAAATGNWSNVPPSHRLRHHPDTGRWIPEALFDGDPNNPLSACPT